MSRLEEHSTATHENLIFPCECHDWHYLRITWDDSDPRWRTMWVEHHQRPRGKRRITDAWRALRGADTQSAEIILTPEIAQTIHDWIETKLAKEVSDAGS